MSLLSGPEDCRLRVIIDYDGTLTAEEEQARPLAERSLTSLADIVGVARERLAADYQAARARLLGEPHRYGWEVNGLIASYCDEGAFMLNTTTLQTMLRENPTYAGAVVRAYPHAEYDPIVDRTNDLFHRHTAELPPVFRPSAHQVLSSLIAHPQREPVILTNSLGDKVRRHLWTIGLGSIAVLGDTRQYEMDPCWQQRFAHPQLGPIHVWPVSDLRRVYLRRPAYYRALLRAASDGSPLVVVADTFSLPGALPLMMGIPFFLLRTSYTPEWCLQVVTEHPLGQVLSDLSEVPQALDVLAPIR